IAEGGLKGRDGGRLKTPASLTLTDLTLTPKRPASVNARADMTTRLKAMLANSAYQYLARLMLPSKLNRNELSVNLTIAKPSDGRLPPLLCEIGRRRRISLRGRSGSRRHGSSTQAAG